LLIIDEADYFFFEKTEWLNSQRCKIIAFTATILQANTIDTEIFQTLNFKTLKLPNEIKELMVDRNIRIDQARDELEKRAILVYCEDSQISMLKESFKPKSIYENDT
jgi:hypothetical protein